MEFELHDIIQFYIHQLKSSDKLSIEERHQYQDFLFRYCEVESWRRKFEQSYK